MYVIGAAIVFSKTRCCTAVLFRVHSPCRASRNRLAAATANRPMTQPVVTILFHSCQSCKLAWTVCGWRGARFASSSSSSSTVCAQRPLRLVRSLCVRRARACLQVSRSLRRTLRSAMLPSTRTPLSTSRFCSSSNSTACNAPARSLRLRSSTCVPVPATSCFAVPSPLPRQPRLVASILPPSRVRCERG